MPNYIYRCPSCDLEEEISHSMSEVDSPSKKLLEATTCNHITCPHDKKSGDRFVRVPQLFRTPADNLINNKPKRDSFLKDRRKRNNKHFKDEILPSLPVDEQKFYKKKHGYNS